MSDDCWPIYKTSTIVLSFRICRDNRIGTKHQNHFRSWSNFVLNSHISPIGHQTDVQYLSINWLYLVVGTRLTILYLLYIPQLLYSTWCKYCTYCNNVTVHTVHTVHTVQCTFCTHCTYCTYRTVSTWCSHCTVPYCSAVHRAWGYQSIQKCGLYELICPS